MTNPFQPPNANVTAAEAPSSAERAPSNVLEYVPERRGTDSSAVAIYTLILPLLLAVVLGIVGSPELALPAAAGMAIFMWRHRRRRKVRPAAILEVVDGRLLVIGEKRVILLDTKLENVLNVLLDTKTIERVQENAGSAIPDLRFAQSVVLGAVDTSRIELTTAERSVFLTEEYLSSIDTTDWLGKIRRMLRKNGWVPASERKAA